MVNVFVVTFEMSLSYPYFNIISTDTQGTAAYYPASLVNRSSQVVTSQGSTIRSRGDYTYNIGGLATVTESIEFTGHRVWSTSNGWGIACTGIAKW